MERFDKIPSSIEKQENILNDWDRKYLTEGSRGVIFKMYEDFGKNFPDVIIIPETSARPLFYILKPIFNKLNKEKGTNVPKFVFFNVGQKPDDFQKKYEQKGFEIKNTEDAKNLLKKEYPTKTEETIAVWAEEMEVEKVNIAKKKMKERADEIKRYLEKNSNTKMAILDEFEAIGQTNDLIKKSFNLPSMPSYSIAGFYDSGALGTHGYDFTLDTPGEDLTEEEKGHYSKNPKHGRIKFSYSGTRSVGVTKEYDKKYTTAIRPINELEAKQLAKEKKQLREEMSVIGENIAHSISSDIDEKYEKAKSNAKNFIANINDIVKNQKKDVYLWELENEMDEIRDNISKKVFTFQDIDISKKQFNTLEEEVKQYQNLLGGKSMVSEFKAKMPGIMGEGNGLVVDSSKIDNLFNDLKNKNLSFQDVGTSREELENLWRKSTKKFKENVTTKFNCKPEEIAWKEEDVKNDTRVYIGRLFPGIFSRGIENIYISFPNNAIEQYSFELDGKTKEKILSQLKSSGVYVFDEVKDIINNENFHVSNEKRTINLVRLTLSDLGLTTSDLSIDAIYKRAKELGLELCPEELGPQLRLSYRGGYGYSDYGRIGMKPITYNGKPVIFDLYNLKSKDNPALRVDEVDKMGSGNIFIFCKP